MIPRQRLIQIADRDGVSAPTVERDYVLTHVVAALAQDAGSDRLVFKGGTALRLCYFDDYRYSADLDLTVVDGDEDFALEALARTLTVCQHVVGFPELLLTDEARPRIRYRGPLGRVRQVKLDIDVDELVFPCDRAPLIERYDDVPDSPGLVTFGLDQVAAEKMRCLIQRLQCRDIYDLHRLLHDAGVDEMSAWEMFLAKARHRGLDPARFFSRLEEHLPSYRDRWTDELSVHLGNDVPAFDAVVRQLKRRLRRLV